MVMVREPTSQISNTLAARASTDVDLMCDGVGDGDCDGDGDDDGDGDGDGDGDRDCEHGVPRMLVMR